MTKRLYDTTRWRALRERQLAKHPLCDMCLRRGIHKPAMVADHTIPHHGNPQLFFDTTNLSSLCQPCHDTRKRMIEKHGHSQACGVDGLPLDSGHGWYREEKANRSKKREEDRKHREGKGRK